MRGVRGRVTPTDEGVRGVEGLLRVGVAGGVYSSQTHTFSDCNTKRESGWPGVTRELNTIFSAPLTPSNVSTKRLSNVSSMCVVSI